MDIDKRDELFRISATKGIFTNIPPSMSFTKAIYATLFAGAYPQIFLESPGGQITYVVDFEYVKELNEVDSMPAHHLYKKEEGSARILTEMDADVKGFKEVFKHAIEGRSPEEAAQHEDREVGEEFVKKVSVKERMSLFSGGSSKNLDTGKPKKGGRSSLRSSLKSTKEDGEKEKEAEEEPEKEQEKNDDGDSEEAETPKKRRSSLEILRDATKTIVTKVGRRTVQLKPDGFRLVGSGLTFDEMHDVLDEKNAMVYYGLMRFTVGQGSPCTVRVPESVNCVLTVGHLTPDSQAHSPARR